MVEKFPCLRLNRQNKTQSCFSWETKKIFCQLEQLQIDLFLYLITLPNILTLSQVCKLIHRYV
jgi:hypothetical protein